MTLRKRNGSTLRDVATRAGVSVATASRVASGSTAVRGETRERVERAMRELLYVPTGRRERTSAIGLLVPEFRNPIFGVLALAMERHASAAGFASILCCTAASAERELEYVHMLLERRVEGMVFICAEVTDLRGEHSHYGDLRERGARMVFVNGGSELADVTNVGVDERAAGRIATEHLLELGHRSIGFVAGDPYAFPTREKQIGRAEALAAAGIDPNGSIAHGPFTVEGGRQAFNALLESASTPPTAVICSNDLMAIGVVHQALDLGLRIPEDLSVVGFDGTDVARWTKPPLTTIEQPTEEIARTTLRALGRLIEDGDESLPNFVFRPRLRLGGTTAPPAGATT